LRAAQDKYFENLKYENVQRDVYHKEILLVILEATRKKKFGEKKIKEKVVEKYKKEIKKEEVDTKKEAPPTAKKEEVPVKKEAPVGAKQETTATKAPATKTETPSATVTPPVVSSAKTATKIATSGLLAAASMSVRGETGGKSLESVSADAKKVGQIVPNDPKPGVSSYGIFGLNSGGSVQNFVKDNPQFNLSTYKPASKEFDDAWKKVAEERTREFFDAQVGWYDKYVYQPVKKDMQVKLPQNLSSDDGVITYMADRRNQMGKLHEDAAIMYASNSKDPKEFISKIAEHDSSDEYIRKAFPTYLKTHGDKNIKGLQKRVMIRKEMSLGVSGNQIFDMSVENKDMRKQMSGSSQAIIIQQNNNTVMQPTTVITPTKQNNTNPVLR
jgi:hypothetical protein